MKMTKEKDTWDAVNEIILESISDGVFTVNHNWRIVTFNRAAEEITGTSRKEAIGRYCWEVFRSNMCEGDCPLKRTMREGKPFVSSFTYIINNEQQRIPIEVSTSLLKSGDGEILGGVETFRDHSVVEELKKELSSSYQVGDMVSRSPAMMRMFSILPQVAESDSTVLIQGETGTGKEVTASALHNLSTRKDQPFIAVNCGALPDSLLESELFGYKAGAFTGATKDKQGLFGAASGGTILLDEIGDTSSAFQVRLLRVLEEKEFQPLGSVTRVKTDVRIIAATNCDLEQMVAEGTFRRDLFYRINIIRFQLPPLRERREDIPLLVERFITKLNHLKNRQIRDVNSAAMALLLNHNYPGNIRELENIIEHGFVLCNSRQIELSHLPVYLHEAVAKGKVSGSKETRRPVKNSLQSAEGQAILEALARNNNNRQAAARELGIHKSTLFRKIKKYNIPLPEQDGRSKSL